MRKGVRGGRKPSPGFLRSAARIDTSGVPDAILKQARKSGQLNLSNRSLEVVPSSVWRINTDPPPDQNASFNTGGDDKWWDQVELFKLILAANQIKDISEDIRLLTALVVLDIHSNKLSGLPDSISELQQLKRLILSQNELSSLPSSLTSLTDLVVLKLDHNQLRTLPEDFGQLVHLEELDVSHNQLSRLPSSLGGLANLHILATTDNSLETIPQELGSLPALKQLSLTKNKLSDLPDFSGASSMQVIYCNYNALSQLPRFQQGSGIKELHMGFNKLKKVDPEILSGLSSLMYLDLRDNRLGSIPESIVEVTTLERLDLTNNDLPGLPYVIGNMPNLKSLLLDGNPLKGIRRDIVQKGTVAILKYLSSRIQTDDIPDPVHHSTKFTPTKQRQNPQVEEARDREEMTITLDSKSVDISKKSLTELPQEIYTAVQLRTLNAGNNKLSSILPEIGVFTVLTVLDIRNNQVSDLPQELERCSKLSEVVLSCNRFNMIPSVLYKLKSIETIMANDNQIQVIDVDGLLQLPMLSCLDLQNNNISSVPPRLGTVSSLKHLQLGGNPFRIPRATILSKGTASILDYLKDRIPT